MLWPGGCIQRRNRLRGSSSMKVIDKNPFQAENGETNLLQRLQSLLRYGSSWNAELEAQKQIIVQWNGVLDEGYTLIRNLRLPGSQTIEPLILVGPTGVFVLQVSRLRGLHEAKNDQRNTIQDETARPASTNLLRRASKLARALQTYLERQGVVLRGPVEPILLASSPAKPTDSLRPIAGAVPSDVVTQFGVSLQQRPSVLSAELVHDIVDRLINSRPKGALAEPVEQAVPVDTRPPEAPVSETPSPASRARAIFRAAEEAKPFDPSDVSFALDEETRAGVPANLRETSTTRPVPKRRRPRALRAGQWIVLGAMLLVELCILGGFGYLIFTAGR